MECRYVKERVWLYVEGDLKQKAQLDRLVGQVTSMGPDKSAIIVVLCGDTNPALVTRFKEVFKLTDFLVFSTGIVVELKDPTKKPKKAAAKSSWW